MSITLTFIMNLWDSPQLIRQVFLWPAVFFCLFSCDNSFKNDPGIPAKDPGDLLNASYIDSFDIACATVLQDSIISSATTNVLVGKYQDIEFGTVEASAYMQAAPLSYPIGAIPAAAVFDSLDFFFLPINLYGVRKEDTASSKLKLQIRSLTDTIHPDRRLYTFNKPTSFGTTRDEIEFFSGKALNSRKLRFKANQLGLLWFQALKSGNSDNYNQFIEKVKPFSLEFVGTDQGILGLELRVRSTTNFNFARIHYKIKKQSNPAEDSAVSLTLQVSDGQPHYTNVSANREGTALSALSKTNPLIPSEILNRKNYLQMSTGVMTYIGFPDLLVWGSKNRNALVLRAELEIKPVNDQWDFPPFLELIRANAQRGFSPNWNLINNLIINEQSGATGYGARLFFKNTEEPSYRLNITPYITDVLKGREANNGFFVFHNPAQLGVNRLIFGDRGNTNATLRLKIHYTMP